MAIRIRKIDGHTIALCAAVTKPKEGDLYLDDAVHHALSTKFGLDWFEEGRLDDPLADDAIFSLANALLDLVDFTNVVTLCQTAQKRYPKSE